MSTEDHWTLTNFSLDKTYVAENPEGGGEHVKVPPRRIAAPIPFEISRVVLPAGHGLVTFLVFAPMHAYLDKVPTGASRGDRTLTAFPLDLSSKYFLVLLALCEPRLRDQSHVAIPTVGQVVQRLRPLPSCTDLTEAAVTFHIDYLARTKLRVKHDEPGIQRLDTKRAALVSLALRFNLVREEHLRLLPPRIRTAPSRGPPRRRRTDMITTPADTSDWAVQVPIGYRVGRWEITAAIATGSWGSVYEARSIDQRPSRPVALKLLPTGTVSPRQLAHLAQMVRREAKLHQALAHPRLIQAYQVLTIEDRANPELDGTVALVMECAECSLADVLQRNPGRPVPEAPRLVEQICEGLAYMHRTG